MRSQGLIYILGSAGIIWESFRPAVKRVQRSLDREEEEEVRCDRHILSMLDPVLPASSFLIEVLPSIVLLTDNEETAYK